MLIFGTELSVIAAVQVSGPVYAIAVVNAVWCLSSLVGGFVYGAASRTSSVYVLAAALGAATLLVGLGGPWWSFGLLLVPAGRVGDVRGRRSMFVLALGLFTLASLACGLAPSSTFLVVARLVQGLAGGLLTPQIAALIQQLFRGPERGRAFGLFGTVVGISTAVGPFLGGLLIAAFGADAGWRYVFLVNLPIGLAASSERVSVLAPEPARGVVTGLHGSAITLGAAVGTPLAGLLIDVASPNAAVVAIGLAGTALAGLAALIARTPGRA